MRDLDSKGLAEKKLVSSLGNKGVDLSACDSNLIRRPGDSENTYSMNVANIQFATARSPNRVQVKNTVLATTQNIKEPIL